MDILILHREKFVFAGYLVGLAGVLDVLPTDLLSLGAYTVYIYIGVVLLGAYTFMEFYHKRAPFIGTKASEQFKSTMQKQYSESAPNPPQDIFKKFHEDK